MLWSTCPSYYYVCYSSTFANFDSCINTSELVSPSHNDETNANLLSLNCGLYDSIQLSKSTIHDLRFVSLYNSRPNFTCNFTS